MDENGEILLQTIAILAGKTPKKSQLPKSITPDRFNAHYEEAFDLLDKVGKFLDTRLGVGVSKTSKLIPYKAILAPMTVVFKSIETLNDAEMGAAHRHLENWFIGSAISNYQYRGDTQQAV